MYLKVMEFIRSIKQQNTMILKSLRNLKDRVEFIESLSLNVPEFNQAFEKINEFEKSELSKLNKIVSIISEYYQVNKVSILRSKSQKREFVKLRQITHYFCKKYTELSLSCIGVHIGSKNHATVLYSDNTVKSFYSFDKQYIKEIDDIDKRISKKIKKKIQKSIKNSKIKE
jgi:chromosomal replication initiator protein